MKKLLSFALCIVLVLSMGIIAFAETNSVVLTYSNEASYQIEIPPSVSIDAATGRGQMVVGLSNVNVGNDAFVFFSVNSNSNPTGYEDGFWYLTDVNDENNKIAYQVLDEGENIIYTNEIASVMDDYSTTLDVVIIDDAKVGTFTDILTFEAQLIQAS